MTALSSISHPAKLTIERQITYASHRSGWRHAQASIAPLLRGDGAGVLLDTMIERNFAREHSVALVEGRVPYRRPWVAFVHVPPDLPEWFDSRKSFREIAQLPAWRESWPHCRGLFTLSRTMQRWLAARVDVPVVALHHPTEFPEVRFDWDEYMRHGQRVVQVGWWLRRLAAIYFLAIPAHRKAVLVPQAGAGLVRFEALLRAEIEKSGSPPLGEWGIAAIPHVPNDEYDLLLSSSVVFLNLHGAVANNAIIECIVRATPVLVNSLPSVREYLGEDYPLFYSSMDEAAAKASDPALVRAAHEYLKAMDTSFLSGETFCRRMAGSEIYRSLPTLP